MHMAVKGAKTAQSELHCSSTYQTTCRQAGQEGHTCVSGEQSATGCISSARMQQSGRNARMPPRQCDALVGDLVRNDNGDTLQLRCRVGGFVGQQRRLAVCGGVGVQQHNQLDSVAATACMTQPTTSAWAGMQSTLPCS